MVFKPDLQGAGAFWMATGLAGLSLVLVIVNGVLTLSNESARTEVNLRQISINQWIQEARQNQDLVQMLALAAVRNNNSAAREVLSRNGLNIVVNQPGTSDAAAPAAGGSAAPVNPPLRKATQ